VSQGLALVKDARRERVFISSSSLWMAAGSVIKRPLQVTVMSPEDRGFAAAVVGLLAGADGRQPRPSWWPTPPSSPLGTRRRSRPPFPSMPGRFRLSAIRRLAYAFLSTLY
jgi:hypothetical protein